MKVKIEFEVELPDIPHTNEELELYLRFQFRDNAALPQNPFEEYAEKMEHSLLDLSPAQGTFKWKKIEN